MTKMCLFQLVPFVCFDELRDVTVRKQKAPFTKQLAATPGLAVLGLQAAMLQEKLSKCAGPARAPCASGKSRGRRPDLHTHSETASAFLFGLSLLLSRNLCPFLLPIQGPHPNISPSWHQTNSLFGKWGPGSKRAQAVVYRVLYTMNLFAFANSLKIVPPLIVIEGSGETG